MTLPQEIIRAKRDGRELTAAEIAEFIGGLTSGDVTEGQAAAFAMAVFFRGMSLAERVALTEAMTLSGTTIDWGAPDLPGPVLDKHSTGGVGDNVSLMLAPMLAALGAFVPMISGRGLGHTGGTLDKLDSIPGYDTKPDLLRFRQVVRDVGCAIIGQTETLAPADRRLYAIRDVTATVESVALITASILSKKLAAGLEALVMDVKTGSGAFMPTLEGVARTGREHRDGGDRRRPADRLADHRHERAARQRRRQRGRGAERRRFPDRKTPGPPASARDAVARGRAFAPGGARPHGGRGRGADARHARIGQGGGNVRAHGRGARRPIRLSRPRLGAAAPRRRRGRGRAASGAASSRTIDVRAIGLAVVELGGGRARAADAIDPSVGLTKLAARRRGGRPGAAAGDRARPRRALGRGGGPTAARRLPPRRRRAPPRRSGRRAHSAGAMTILFAAPDMDAAPWRARLPRGCRSHVVVSLGEPFDPGADPLRPLLAPSAGGAEGPAELKAIFSLGAGVDHLFADPALPEAPIVRIVDPDLRDRMSEWVVMHALAHLRQLRRYERQQREKIWADDEAQPKAADVTVGVLGLGVLGTDAATKLAALGFESPAGARRRRLWRGSNLVHGPDGLRRLLARTDMLVALLPLTPDTRGLLNAALFAQLKQGGPLGGPILINAGRGGSAGRG